MAKKPLYPHVPKSKKPVEAQQQTGEQLAVFPGSAVAADRALTLAKWLVRRRETAAGPEHAEFEKLAADLESAGLPSLANKARETKEKELEVVKSIQDIAKEIRHTFPGLR